MSAVLQAGSGSMPKFRHAFSAFWRFVLFNRLHVVAMGPGIVLFWNQFLGLRLDGAFYALVTCCVLFGYVANIYFDHREDAFNGEIVRERWIGRNKRTLALAALALIVTLVPAAAQGSAYLALVSGTLLGAGLYSAPLAWRGRPWRVKAQPWLKNVYAAFHWSVLLLLLAEVYAGGDLMTAQGLLIASICFGMNFFVELLWDVRDIDGDRLAGVKTLATNWGARRAGWCLQAVNLVICAAVLGGIASGLLPGCFWMIVPHGLLILVFVRWYVHAPSRRLASHLYVLYVMGALLTMSVLHRW